MPQMPLQHRRYSALHPVLRLADNVPVSGDTEIRRRATRHWWTMLTAWYAGFAALATFSGRFAASPWPICAVLFGVLEAATFFVSMHEDDWANDFRGDREILVRGTVANALVAVAFTAVGIGLRAL